MMGCLQHSARQQGNFFKKKKKDRTKINTQQCYGDIYQKLQTRLVKHMTEKNTGSFVSSSVGLVMFDIQSLRQDHALVIILVIGYNTGPIDILRAFVKP